MALTAYTRFRFGWGLIDASSDDEAPTYDATNTQDGIAAQDTARRAILRWTRAGISEDVMQTHFDIVNITTGELDATWTAGDFTTCEAALLTLWGSYKTLVSDEVSLSEIRWYRVGPGATPPEPAVRTTAAVVPATSTSSDLPWQVSSSISWKTALRKRWGRSYMPGPTAAQLVGTTGRWQTTFADALAQYAHTYVQALAAGDFYPVVWSPQRQRLYNVEKVMVDDIPDIIRRRRSRNAPYRKTYP